MRARGRKRRKAWQRQARGILGRQTAPGCTRWRHVTVFPCAPPTPPHNKHSLQLFGEKDGTWLFALARGVDDGEFTARTLPKSLSCGKSFRGNYALTTMEAVTRWLGELGGWQGYWLVGVGV